MPNIVRTTGARKRSRERVHRSHEASREPGRKIPDDPVLVVRRKSTKKQSNPVMERIRAHQRGRSEVRKRKRLVDWREDLREREAMGLSRGPTKRQRQYLVANLEYRHSEVSKLTMGEAADIIDKHMNMLKRYRERAGLHVRREKPMWIKSAETEE